jgi:ABC-type branched-subunit amino acid transport system ATPase component
VLWGVDLAVLEGELLAVIGRNGMGKTTLMGAIMGMVVRGPGTVRLTGATALGPTYMPGPASATSPRAGGSFPT